jgi:phosphatidylserine synthase
MSFIESVVIIYWLVMNNTGLVNPVDIALAYLIMLVFNFYLIDKVSVSDLKKSGSNILGIISRVITLFLFFTMIFKGLAFWWIYIIYILLLISYILTRRGDMVGL